MGLPSSAGPIWTLPPPHQVDETIASLKKFKVERIGVCHCTGPRAAARLYAEFGERFFFGQVGEVLEV